VITKHVLSRPQRAAAILVAMGKPRASGLLKYFDSQELRAMLDAGSTLKSIPQPDVEELVHEFEVEFAKGSGLLNSGEAIRTMMAGILDDEQREANGKGAETTSADKPLDVWAALAKRDADVLSGYLGGQSKQVAAIILAHLPARNAAKLLELLPAESRPALMARMLDSRPIPPALLTIIEQNIALELGLDKGTETDTRSNNQLAGILNELDRDISDQLLESLSVHGDPKRMSSLKALLFRFEDIGQLSKEARSRLCDGLPSDLLTLSLHGAEPDLQEAILGSISQRTRRMIESELSGGQAAKPAKVEEARRSIASLAIKMAAEGKIELAAAA
jgi:flagellar motor switch protein FliG